MTIILEVIINNTQPLVIANAVLCVSKFQNVLVYATLQQFSAGLEIEDSIDFCVLNQLFDVTFLQRARSNHSLKGQI